MDHKGDKSRYDISSMDSPNFTGYISDNKLFSRKQSGLYLFKIVLTIIMFMSKNDELFSRLLILAVGETLDH